MAASLLAVSAGAAPPRVTLEAGTDVPLGIGAGVDAEVGPRIRLGLSALWLPEAYVAVADEVGQAVGGYDDVTSALVRASTENALAVRARVGVRPVPAEGFYVDLVYTLVALGGAFTAEDLGAASGAMAEEDAAGWDLGSTVHQLGAEVGWRFGLVEALTLRVGLGGSFTVAADSSAVARSPSRPRLAAAAGEAGEAYLEDVFTSYVHVPVLTVALGWDVLGGR